MKFTVARIRCGILLPLLTWTVLMASVQAQTTDPQPTPTTLDGGVQTLTNVPEAIQTALTQQIQAANDRKLDAVMAGYSAEFKHQDGLDREQTRQAITQLWQSHPQLTYKAQVKSWQQEGSEYVAVVATSTVGQQLSERGTFTLKGTTEVRNRYRQESGQWVLISQEVLKESSTLTSGSAPPTVTIKLPDSVKAGSTYRLEAIVAEPLKSNVLLGGVISEKTAAAAYNDTPSFPLAPLQSGGLFRQGDAPKEPGSEWISIMLVNQGGITLESRRIRITS